MENVENNVGIVATLKNLTKIPNKDKIVQADVCLNGMKVTQVIVSVDQKENESVIYVDSNLTLCDELLKNYPDLGKYLAKGNRVKAIKLSGILSNGLVISLDKFYKYFKSEEIARKTLIHGYSFYKIGDVELFKKYIPKIQHTQNTAKNKKAKGKIISRMINNQFNFHIDTKHLLRNVHKITPNSLISISDKWHGSSIIVSNCLVKKQLNWYEKLLKSLKIKITDTEYDYIYSSRRVVKNGIIDNTKHYYKVDIWTKAGEFFKNRLHEGETVYGEIVGYTPDGKAIQKNKYGVYDYGCEEGQFKVYVYRMTYTNPEGIVLEYPMHQVKERCNQIGANIVKESYYGIAKDKYPEIPIDENWNINFINKLKKEYLEKLDETCKSKVPSEGIVLRIEGLEIDSYKLKSELFVEAESKQKEDETFVDVEDVN